MSVDIKKVVGGNIRALRLGKGWSQEALGLEAGIHRTYIGDVERGERNISVVNLQRIADALGVCAGDLVAARTTAECRGDPVNGG